MEKVALTLLSPAATGTVSVVREESRQMRADRESRPEGAERIEPIRAEDVDSAVRDINEFVQSVQRDLRFSVDENSGRTIITVLDSQTEEVVRQIPPEKLVAAAENIEHLRGLLFEAKA
ncbi:MAG: flagellar protein FlaG [Ectothiorhodospiraceae bacterium]|nr:flagellar protein FlaG [Ectothiorhodospiraceae bacterium]MCH8506842.1 flagellar protein FlaG [Ectothiorhodospiraceae bacterium]